MAAKRNSPERDATTRSHTADNDDPRVKAAVEKYARGISSRGDLTEEKKNEMLEKYAQRMRVMLPQMTPTH